MATKRLTTEEIVEIKRLLVKNELLQKEIADLFGISFQLVSNIKTGAKHSDKGRSIDLSHLPHGGNHVLSGATAEEIRALILRGGMYQKDIAKKYGVTQGTISRIKLRRTHGLLSRSRKFSSDDVVEIKEMRGSGIGLKEIAAKFDTSVSWVSEIASGKSTYG